MSAAETLHLTALQQLTHRGDIPKGSWPEKLERVTVLSPDNSRAVTDIQAVIENKGKGTIQLPKFTHVPVSMNRHTVAEKLVKALAAIDRGSVDLILITRGGGHWTDLWSFNDPELARAIHQRPVPVMVAIGHAADHTSNAERIAVDCFSTPTAFGHELVRKLYARNGARKPRAATVPASTSRTASTQTQLDAQRERCRELEQMNAVNSSHAKEWRSAFLNELHASGTARVKNHWATVALVAMPAGVIAAMIATAKSEDLTAPTAILIATAVVTALVGGTEDRQTPRRDPLEHAQSPLTPSNGSTQQGKPALRDDTELSGRRSLPPSRTHETTHFDNPPERRHTWVVQAVANPASATSIPTTTRSARRHGDNDLIATQKRHGPGRIVKPSDGFAVRAPAVSSNKHSNSAVRAETTVRPRSQRNTAPPPPCQVTAGNCPAKVGAGRGYGCHRPNERADSHCGH